MEFSLFGNINRMKRVKFIYELFLPNTPFKRGMRQNSESELFNSHIATNDWIHVDDRFISLLGTPHYGCGKPSGVDRYGRESIHGRNSHASWGS